MRPKSLVLLALALGCGLIAAVGINQILATPSAKETVSIVVAKNEIQKGDEIKPDDIRLQEWHVDSLPEGAITKIDDLAERRVKNLIVPGEAILVNKLVAKGATDNEIPPGMKAVTVQVDAETGLSGLISPGDNVDVVHTTPANAMTKTAMTKELFRNIKVHAIDTETSRPDAGEKSAVAKTVTLLVNAKQALAITHAKQSGTITLIGRSTKDNTDEAQEGSGVVTDGSLHETGTETASAGPSLPTLAPAPEPAKPDAFSEGVNSLTDLLREMQKTRDLGPEKPVTPPWKMVVIEGTDAKEMEFNGDSKLPTLAGAKPAADGDRAAAPDESEVEKGPAESPSTDDGFSRLPPIELEIPTASP